MAYKPFGPVKSMDLGPLALTRSYDQRYQVTGIQAGTVLNYGYTHDGAGNVETISGLPKPDLTPRQTDVAYTGNRLTSIDTLWTIPPDYPATGASYAYDNAGNIVSDGLHTDYFHNQNNRLIRVEIDGLTVAEYAYDAFERRAMKVVNGVTNHFHYDLNGLLISETDGNGNPRKDYVYLNGEPVAMRVYGGSARWYWFVNDHLGTPQKMVDESGSVVWAAAYAPFGEARVYQDEVVNNLRFPGQYYDVETGLHYNWHRYYDPGTGRYLTPDPIGLEGGVNLYAYVNNDPVNWIDPYGLTGVKIPLSAIKKALKKVHQKIGGPLPKAPQGKFGSPQRGTPKKGYRLDKEGHPKSSNPNEKRPHINYWDYSKGKRGKGGISDAEPIIWGFVGFLGDLLDPFGAISGELGNPEEDRDQNGIPDYWEKNGYSNPCQ